MPISWQESKVFLFENAVTTTMWVSSSWSAALPRAAIFRICREASSPSMFGMPRSIRIRRYARKSHPHGLLIAVVYISTAIWPSTAISISRSYFSFINSYTGTMLKAVSSTIRIRALHSQLLPSLLLTSIELRRLSLYSLIGASWSSGLKTDCTSCSMSTWAYDLISSECSDTSDSESVASSSSSRSMSLISDMREMTGIYWGGNFL